MNTQLAGGFGCEKCSVFRLLSSDSAAGRGGDDDDDDDDDELVANEQSIQIRNVDDALWSFSFHSISNRLCRSPDFVRSFTYCCCA